MERSEEALQIPIQAVYEQQGHTYCLVPDGNDWNTREISIKSTNNKTVALDDQLDSGVEEGDFVVANARRHAHKFTIPEDPAVAASDTTEKNNFFDKDQNNGTDMPESS